MAYGLEALKTAFQNMLDLQFLKALGALPTIGGGLIAGAVSGFTTFSIVRIYNNNNLTLLQKILLTLPLSISVVLGLPLLVAVIAGASFLVPPFMFVGSVAGVFRGISAYLQNRAERNNLRKELITRESLVATIDKIKLTSGEKEALLDYTFKPQEIYSSFYQLRQNIIKDTSISSTDKEILINTINQQIENFGLHSNEKIALKHATLTLEGLSAAAQTNISHQLETINNKIDNYNQSCVALERMRKDKTLSSTVLFIIDAYKTTRAKIYAQNLPESIKDNIVKMIEGKTIEENDLNLLYASIGNHYIDSIAGKQLELQDANMLSVVLKHLPGNEANVVREYYQFPRQIYHSLSAFKQTLSNLDEKIFPEKKSTLDNIDKFIQDFKNDPQTNAINFTALENGIKNSTELSRSLNQIKTEIANGQSNSENFDKILLEGKISSGLKKSIDNYQVTSLQQYIYASETSFDSPNIKFDLTKNAYVSNAIQKTGAVGAISTLKDKIGERVHTTSENIKESIILKMLNITGESVVAARRDRQAAKKNIGQDVSQIRDDFSERFASIFNVIEKKEQLDYLEKSVPRNFANITIGVGIATGSLATTLIIPLLITMAPAVLAPLATVVTVGGLLLSATSFFNTLDLVRRNIKGKLKMDQTKQEVTKGVSPKRKKKERYSEKLREEITSTVKQVQKIEEYPAQNTPPAEKSEGLKEEMKKVEHTLTTLKSSENLVDAVNSANAPKQTPAFAATPKSEGSKDDYANKHKSASLANLPPGQVKKLVNFFEELGKEKHAEPKNPSSAKADKSISNPKPTRKN